MKTIKKYADAIIQRVVKRLYHTNVLFNVMIGGDIGADIARYYPELTIKTMFDIGANIGQSTRQFMTQFPEAHIYAFEPVDTTRQTMIDNIGHTDRVDYYPFAFGSSITFGNMILQGTPDVHCLEGQHSGSVFDDRAERQQCPVVTVDSFCDSLGIDCIDYLKIDTEGGDLDVLYGALGMLRDHRIKFVQVEASMNPDNTYHSSFRDMSFLLEIYGYRLFAIYEQCLKDRVMRRINPVFIAVDKNGG